jgi:PASTA domain
MFQLKAIPLLLVLVVGIVIPSSALAAPPANDAFASAQELIGRTASVDGLNKEATKEPNEPNHAGKTGGASVWYRLTAPASGIAKLSTCQSNFDTLLAAYTGDAVGTLVEVASNDDSCGTKSSLSFAAEEGETYRIAIDGTNGQTEAFKLELRLSPVNDDFATAIVLTGDVGEVGGTTEGASREASEPEYLGDSVWYRWTAPSSGPATFETCGQAVYVEPSVFTGSTLETLTPAPRTYSFGTCEVRIHFDATAGENYSIAVSSYEEDGGGEFTLTWNRNPAPPEPPYALDYPWITGQAREGQTLTVSEGEWIGATPISFSYVWVRCNPNGAGCAPIAGAALRTHSLSAADVGSRLYAVVTGSNVAGSYSEASDPTPVIRPSGPTNTAPPQVSGEARAGEALFASEGTWTGIQPIQYAYQWQECDSAGNACLDLPGENASVLDVRAQHVDSRLRVVVIATNADGARSMASEPSAVVANARRQPAPRCVVPNVRGKSVAKARRMLRAKRCALGRVTRAYSARVGVGKIIRQSRRPAARLPRGTRVHVVVSRGRRR